MEGLFQIETTVRVPHIRFLSTVIVCLNLVTTTFLLNRNFTKLNDECANYCLSWAEFPSLSSKFMC